MRCRYCIYNDEIANSDFRIHTLQKMSYQIGKKSIDYALLHSSNKLSIGFYGGEPMLEFNLLKKIIDYTLDNKGEKEIHFSMTTNMTLITEEKAIYLSLIPNFSIVGSLDGPEDIHNLNRIYRNGKGSFKKALIGLKNLVNAYEIRSTKMIMINMVASSNINNGDLNSIQHFFNDLDWLPKDIVKNISYVKGDFSKSNMNVNYSNPIANWIFKQIENNENSFESVFSKDIIERGLLRIHKRLISSCPNAYIPFNSNCSPASRKLYVTSEGEFKICERIGQSPSIGDINIGIEINSLFKHYIDDYEKYSIVNCSNCWAIKLCPVCYSLCYNSEGFDINKKSRACIYALYTVYMDLVAYFEIYEYDTTIIEKLSDIVLS